MELTTTTRGARTLLYQGYKYTLNRRTADGHIYWRCHDRSCYGRAATDSSDQLVSCNQKHTHRPATTETALEKVKQKMKKRAREETTPIPTIYHEALQEVAQSESRETIAPVLSTLRSMKSVLYRKRREKLPPLPRSVEDLNFDGEWTNPQWRLLHAWLTSCSLPMPILEGWNFSDLSSPVLPGVHAACLQTWAAISTRLLSAPGKTREAYNTSFILLKEAAQNLGFEVDPQRVLTDFELALQQSLAISFPQTEKKGCLFHYSQAIWRKVQSLGIQQLYQGDDEFRSFINSVIALFD